MTIVTAIIAIIAILGMVMTVQLSRKYRVNAAAFTAQIQKLVMANSIDRAIRLCNAVQEAPLPSAVKSLLVRSNRPHELPLYYEQEYEGLTQKASEINNYKGWHGMAALVGNLLLVGILYFATPEADKGGTTTWLVVYLSASILLSGLLTSLHHHLKGSRVYLHKVYIMLLNRQSYTPKSHEVRHLTRQEIEAWQASMDAFNVDYSTRKASGAPVEKVEDEYKANADDRGVLPPL